MATKQKNSKSTDKRPSRMRYTTGKHLLKNKIRRIMRCGPFPKGRTSFDSERDALQFWRSVRTKRTKGVN